MEKDTYVTLRGARLAVRHTIVSQDAPTMVFLHDSLGCISLWRDFPERLGAALQYNIFIYDRQGYGNSDPFGPGSRDKDYMEQEAVLLMELLAACSIQQPVLFGHSDGGTIALLAVAKYPDKIQAVITEGAHVFVEDITLDGIEKAVDQYQHTHLKERLEKYHGDKTEALFVAWTQTWLAPWYRDWNIEHFLPQITCPVLVIQGTEDEYGSAAQVEAIASQVSGPSEICLIPNAGHSPHKQGEIWVIDRCYAFLAKE